MAVWLEISTKKGCKSFSGRNRLLLHRHTDTLKAETKSRKTCAIWFDSLAWCFNSEMSPFSSPDVKIKKEEKALKKKLPEKRSIALKFPGSGSWLLTVPCSSSSSSGVSSFIWYVAGLCLVFSLAPPLLSVTFFYLSLFFESHSSQSSFSNFVLSQLIHFIWMFNSLTPPSSFYWIGKYYVKFWLLNNHCTIKNIIH